MKPVLHIIRNIRDTQAIEVIRKQSEDNSYGVTVVVTDNSRAIDPLMSMSNIRVFILHKTGKDRDTFEEMRGPAEWISYEGLVDLIFQVESIAVW